MSWSAGQVSIVGSSQSVIVTLNAQLELLVGSASSVAVMVTALDPSINTYPSIIAGVEIEPSGFSTLYVRVVFPQSFATAFTEASEVQVHVPASAH